MPDAATVVPVPANEPVRGYAPGSGERASLEARLKELGSAEPVELTRDADTPLPEISRARTYLAAR